MAVDAPAQDVVALAELVDGQVLNGQLDTVSGRTLFTFGVPEAAITFRAWTTDTTRPIRVGHLAVDLRTERRSAFRLELHEAGAIHGTAVNREGRPLTGVTVGMVALSGPFDSAVTEPLRANARIVSTDSEGRFAFLSNALLPGTLGRVDLVSGGRLDHVVLVFPDSGALTLTSIVP